MNKLKYAIGNNFSAKHVEDFAKQYCRGQISGPVLREMNNKLVTRISLNDNETVILKLWSRPGIKGSLRDITRTGALFKEIYALRHLKDTGVRVPEIRGFSRLNLKEIRYTHALILEDINPSETAMIHMGNLIRENLTQEVQIFEDALIQLTTQIINAHIIDPDHSLINILVTNEGIPFRIDFELARHVISKEAWIKGYGEMIGNIVTSFVFAVQPDMNRAKSFSDRLVNILKPSKRVLNRAEIFVNNSLDWQRDKRKIDTKFVIT